MTEQEKLKACAVLLEAMSAAICSISNEAAEVCDAIDLLRSLIEG